MTQIFSSSIRKAADHRAAGSEDAVITEGGFLICTLSGIPFFRLYGGHHMTERIQFTVISEFDSVSYPKRRCVDNMKILTGFNIRSDVDLIPVQIPVIEPPGAQSVYFSTLAVKLNSPQDPGFTDTVIIIDANHSQQ